MSKAPQNPNPTPNPENPQKPKRSAEEQAQLDAFRPILEVLASISARGDRANRTTYPDAHDGFLGEAKVVPEFTGQYTLCRGGRTATITAADIGRARDCLDELTKNTATLEDCRKALRPLAKLPVDLRVANPDAALFIFPAEKGTADGVAITNRIIEKAQDLTS